MADVDVICQQSHWSSQTTDAWHLKRGTKGNENVIGFMVYVG